MANVIKLKQGSGSNPQASDLVLGELAIRTDGTPKLFALNDAGNVVGLGGAPDDGSITSAKIADGAIVNADINASAAIDGTKISPDFGSQNIQTTGSLTGNGLFINSTFPRIQLNDTNNNSDFSIYNGNGFFRIFDDTNSVSRFHIASDGTATFSKNLDCLEGIDVTGNITCTGTIPAAQLTGTLPAIDGSNLTGLQAGATGGNSGANAVFWENQQTVTHDYSISANRNAGSFGPIAINSGVTVTVPSTSNWTIV